MWVMEFSLTYSMTFREDAYFQCAWFVSLPVVLARRIWEWLSEIRRDSGNGDDEVQNAGF